MFYTRCRCSEPVSPLHVVGELVLCQVERKGLAMNALSAESERTISRLNRVLPAKEFPCPLEGNISSLGSQAIAVLVADKEAILRLRQKVV